MDNEQFDEGDVWAEHCLLTIVHWCVRGGGEAHKQGFAANRGREVGWISPLASLVKAGKL
jgi:hypothetical protein